MEMQPSRRFDPGPALALGLCVMFGLIVGGWVLGAQVKAMKLADRYVTVKGLVERTVKADTGLWSLSFKEAGNDLPQVFARSEADKDRLLAFFNQQGFAPADLSVGQVAVTDLQANEYTTNRPINRYIVQQTVTVTTKDVDRLAKAGEKTAELVQAGIVIAAGEGRAATGITYKFTGLNALKPDMITEATRNARASADRFAADSGSQVGSIRSANQGVFSISASGIGASPAADEEGGGAETQADSTIMKTVRVVSTIDYYLVK